MVLVDTSWRRVDRIRSTVSDSVDGTLSLVGRLATAFLSDSNGCI